MVCVSWFQAKIAHSNFLSLLILRVASSQPKVSASGISSEFALTHSCEAAQMLKSPDIFPESWFPTMRESGEK